VSEVDTVPVLSKPGKLVAPNEADRRLAREAGQRLAAYLGEPKPIKMGVVPEGKEQEEAIVLPASVLCVLVDVLAELAAGNAVAVVPVQAELTTQLAADMLNVSRPYLIGLLDKGEIPSRRVGVQRRVLLSDLLAYKQRSEAERLKALEELQARPRNSTWVIDQSFQGD
jgi:excisionase family DNA binding protein